MSLPLADMDRALDAAGIPYVGVGRSSVDPTGAPDWRTRGRPASTGPFIPAGVLCHHTASPAGTSTASDLNVILAGNIDAPGPISQLYIDRDAVVHLVAAGRANHGGKGRRPGVDTGGCADMYACLVGVEVANSGVGEWWPNPQTDIYADVVAALCAWYGWPTASVYLHFTTGPPSGGCNSKIDPAGPWQLEPHLVGSTTWNLDTWRRFVDDHRAGGPTPPDPAPLPEEDDVPVYANKGTYATFMVTGGQCHWIPDPDDADALGVPSADAAGRRGTTLSDGFFRNLILVGVMPSEPGWSPEHFAAWWPDGVPPSR